MEEEKKVEETTEKEENMKKEENLWKLTWVSSLKPIRKFGH